MSKLSEKDAALHIDTLRAELDALKRAAGEYVRLKDARQERQTLAKRTDLNLENRWCIAYRVLKERLGMATPDEPGIDTLAPLLEKGEGNG